MIRIVIDIDGTICKSVADHENYMDAEPYGDMVDLINRMYDKGHYIILLTARGMGTCNGVVAKAYNKWYSRTESQVGSWGLRYHELQFGKPHGDVYIDDRAFRVSGDGSSVDTLKEFLEELDG